ncbi:MAG TPA: hypothetical protein VF042_01970 [Gemmatimonadaceae bacterium]
MRLTRSILYAGILFGLTACSNDGVLDPSRGQPGDGLMSDVSSGAALHVDNVDDLYATVNNSENAGANVFLAPGTYVLTASRGGVARPNAGRLELQPGMSLYGIEGNRSAVVIDMSALPASSFNAAVGKTSALRIGRGSNSIEWLTIRGNPNSAAGVETDIADSGPALVTIAHVAAYESIRGIDLRNTGAAMAGRMIVASVNDNEFLQGNEGIRIVNVGVNTAKIDVSMSGNRIHDNVNGCIIEHNRGNNGVIQIRSSGDRFYNNALGCLIGGGLVAAPGTANSNVTVFEGHGDSFSDNTQPPSGIDFGGLLVIGAETPGARNSASNNSVKVSLWGTDISGNQNYNLQAFGARSTANPAGISGTGNTVTIDLHGMSKRLAVGVVNSLPFEAGGTNTVTVNR